MEADHEENNNQNDDVFLNSKLFNQALSQQTSHYIQSKMMSLPKDAQDLKKLDLRHMCDTVVRQLQVVQKEAAYDYIKVSEQLESLGQQLTVADNIMQQLQNVLYNFKDHLDSIKSQMTSLQEKSNKMNTSLNNKKKVQTILNSFIQSAVLDKQLIDAICLGQINDNYVIHIKALLKKLSYLNSNLISPDSKAVKQLQPQLQKLKARASVRLRQFLLQQIALLKKPKTNIQIMQKNVLSKYKVFTQFFKDQNPGIFTQLCNTYRQIMAKIYMSNFKLYLQEIYKLQVQLYTKTDQVVPQDPQGFRSFIQQIKPTNLNQDKKSIFSLMNRDKIIDQNENNDVILYNVANQKGQKFTLQQIFKSVNKALMDGVLSEVIFCAQFFNLKSEGAIQLFGPLFRPSQNIFLEQLKSTISSTFDIFGVLLILAINQKNKLSFRQKQFGALNFYFDQVSMILLPRFQDLFNFHMKDLMGQTTANFRKIQKTVGLKVLIQRITDFIVSFSRMVLHCPNYQMIQIRLNTFKKAFFNLIQKVCSQFQKQIDGLVYHLNVLEQFYQSFTSDSIISKLPSYQQSQNDLEKQINQLSVKVVGAYMKDFFPSIDGFIKKYCKDQGMTGEDSTLSVQGVVDKKVIQGIIGDLSSATFNSKMQKYIEFGQKTFSGYALKTNLKKFMAIFMKYYNEIYKYIKNNHPQDVSLVLQPHNMMKEIKNAMVKYNV